MKKAMTTFFFILLLTAINTGSFLLYKRIYSSIPPAPFDTAPEAPVLFVSAGRV